MVPAQRDMSKPAKEAIANEHVVEALTQAKLLIEEFTRGKSLTPLFDNARQMIMLIGKDQNLRAYFGELRSYVLEALDNPDMLEDDARMKNLLLRGRSFMQEVKMHEYTTNTLREAREILLAIRSDPVATQFQSDIQTLMRDLFFDNAGQPALKVEALSSIKNIFIGMLMDELKYVNVPRISGANEQMEYAVEPFGLSLFSLLPEDISIKQKGKMHMHPTNIGTAASNVSNSKGRFRVKITKLATRIDNIHYYLRRLKTPRIEDRGVASLDLPYGITLKLDLTAHYSTKYSNFFRVKNVSCHIRKVKLRVAESKHKFLLTLLRPIINNQIRKRAEIGVQDAIMKNIGSLEQRLHYWLESMPLRQTKPALWQRLLPIEKLVPTVNPRTVVAPTTATTATGVPVTY
jgi:hypothetical protein